MGRQISLQRVLIVAAAAGAAIVLVRVGTTPPLVVANGVSVSETSDAGSIHYTTFMVRNNGWWPVTISPDKSPCSGVWIAPSSTMRIEPGEEFAVTVGVRPRSEHPSGQEYPFALRTDCYRQPAVALSAYLQGEE